ncbi:MAG: hypothetical protein RL172_1962 [Bacteroidota bacterium]|jgi:hypothetical protein
MFLKLAVNHLSTIMNTPYLYRSILVITVLFCATANVAAQKDTSKRQSIDITSSYKPVLRTAVKTNFSAAHLLADTSRSVSAYSIPAQNLFYTYQPGSLKPLALQQDTMLELGTRNYIKAGLGNYATPYVNAGFSFGDGKKQLVNVYADYVSSKGTIKNQEYAEMNVKGAGSFFTRNNEVYGSAAVRMQDYHLYGYDHEQFTYTKNEVLQRLQGIKIVGGMRNKELPDNGIAYDPHVEINLFSVKDKATESGLALTVPVYKTFADVFTVKMAVRADITSYSTKNIIPDNVSLSNNIFSISPALSYTPTNNLFTVNAGITPAWDNGKLNVLPNIYGELKLAGQAFIIQAGMVGRMVKNTYQNLLMINPYLQPLSSQLNTRELEGYAGIKGILGNHFMFSAKTSYIRYKNLPLFVSSATDQKNFVISNEAEATNLRLHGDLNYINQDKFTITAGVTINGYTSITDNEKAFGTLPFELNGSLRWWAFKQVLIKADYMGFAGGAVLIPGSPTATLKGGNDLSAGVELAINKRLSAWVDVNNLFNNKYQRWLNYPVYGLNVLGGVIFKF